MPRLPKKTGTRLLIRSADDGVIIKTLIWSVAWGDYRYMLQALMNSIKDVGVECDLLTFSDAPIANVISCRLDPSIRLDTKQYLWKFHYLNKLKDLNYDAFVFIDSDHIFVRKPPLSFSELLGEDSWHTFLESPLNSPKTKRGDWWNVPNSKMVALWRSFGVKQQIVYNTNAGFFICKKEFIEHICKVADLFYQHQKAHGLYLTEEVTVAVLGHLFSRDYATHFHNRYINYWASEWTGSLSNQMPDGNPWPFEEYMTQEKSMVNPAIVHAMRSKQALMAKGREIVENLSRQPSFIPWSDVQ